MDGGSFALSQGDVISARHLVHDAPIVPESNRTSGPLPPDSEVIGIKQMFAQEVEEISRLKGVELFDTVDKGRIVVKRFESSHGMGSHLARC